MDDRDRRRVRARTRLRLLALAQTEPEANEQGPATLAHGNETPLSRPAVSFDPARLTDGELAEIARSQT